MKKRFLNLLMVLALVVCVLPMAASAVGNCTSPWGHLWNNGTCNWCKTDCDHAAYDNGKCDVCGVACEHGNYADGKCSECGIACEHDYVNQGYKAGYEPTCQETGLSILKCSICGHSTVQTAPVVDCDPERVEAVEPTCTTPGKTEGRACRYCGKILRAQTEIAALGHDYQFDATVKVPTCEKKGMDRYRCTRCSSSTFEYPAATGHTPVKKQEEAPTCSEVGRTAGTQCMTCKKILSGMEEIPMVAHTPGTMKSYDKRPTCQETGSATYYCTKCDGTVVQEVRKLNCNIVEIPAVAATCTTDGATAGSECTICSDTTNDQNCAYCAENTPAPETVAALGHELSLEEWIKEPSCTAAGEGKYLCTRCNKYKTQSAEAYGHDMEEYRVEEATCTEVGRIFRLCKRCELVETERVKALGHTEEIVPAVAATCTGTGLTEGKICSVCSETLVAQTVTDMVAHDFSVDVEGKPASCTEDGYTAHKKCANCDATEGKEEIDTDGHNFVNYICTECGTRDGSCEHEGAEINVVNSTCTIAGSKSFCCGICGYQYVETLPLTAHQRLDKSYAATCTTKGLQHVVCSICNQDLVREEIPVADHSIVNGSCTICGTSTCDHSNVTTERDASTCSERGYVIETCTDCGKITTRELPLAAHNYVNGICSGCGRTDKNRVTYDFQDVFIVG